MSKKVTGTHAHKGGYRGNKSADPSSYLTFDMADYFLTDTLASRHSEKELRREYSRLRGIANKRLERMGQTEYRYSNVYQENAGAFVPVRAIESKQELASQLRDVTRFLTSKRGSVTGMRDYENSIIESLHNATPERGAFDFVNKENLAQFGRFMDYVKGIYGAGNYSSDRVMQAWQNARERGIAPSKLMKDFEKYVETFDKEPQPVTKPKKVYSSEEYIARLGNLNRVKKGAKLKRGRKR